MTKLPLRELTRDIDNQPFIFFTFWHIYMISLGSKVMISFTFLHIHDARDFIHIHLFAFFDKTILNCLIYLLCWQQTRPSLYFIKIKSNMVVTYIISYYFINDLTPPTHMHIVQKSECIVSAWVTSHRC